MFHRAGNGDFGGGADGELTDADAHRLLHQAGGQLGPAFAGLNTLSYLFRPIFGTGEKPVEAVESPIYQASTPIERNLARRRARRSSRGTSSRASRASPMAAPSSRAASSGLVCAPPSGSGTIPSITPSSRQWAASGLNAAAALRFSPASRQRIAAQPSGEITE